MYIIPLYGLPDVSLNAKIRILKQITTNGGSYSGEVVMLVSMQRYEF